MARITEFRKERTVNWRTARDPLLAWVRGKQAMKNEAEKSVRQAVVFELEHVATNGHALLYDTLKDALEKKSIDLTGPLFARFFINSDLDAALEKFLAAQGRKQISAEKLAEEVHRDYVKALTSGKSTVAAGLEKLLGEAEKNGVAVGAVSCLDEESAEQVAEHLGLTARGVVVRPSGMSYGHCIDKNEWTEMTLSLSARPLTSVAIASNGESCRAALAAGMHVVVRPGRHADFADFSGADLIVDELDGKLAAQIIALPEPSSWS